MYFFSGGGRDMVTKASLGSNPDSAVYLLCELGYITVPSGCKMDSIRAYLLANKSVHVKCSEQGLEHSKYSVNITAIILLQL